VRPRKRGIDRGRYSQDDACSLIAVDSIDARELRAIMTIAASASFDIRLREEERERIISVVPSSRESTGGALLTHQCIDTFITERADETACLLSRRTLEFGESDLVATLTSSSRWCRRSLSALTGVTLTVSAYDD